MKEMFHKFAAKVAVMTGSSIAFVLALSIIIVWALTGPIFHFSDTWQLVINTSTTIITFLMVFLIQNTQNRDSKALHLKLDELIRASGGARNSFIDLEDISDHDLAELNEDFQELHRINVATPLLHKLHKKVAAEHKRRLTTQD